MERTIVDHNINQSLQPFRDARDEFLSLAVPIAGIGMGATGLIQASASNMLKRFSERGKRNIIKDGVITYQEMLNKTGIGSFLLEKGGIKTMYMASIGVGICAGIAKAYNEFKERE